MLHQDADTTSRDPNVEDTPTLIASDRVEGTRVYGADGKHIGSIERSSASRMGALPTPC